MDFNAASVFNTSHGALGMLTHEKTMFDPYIDTLAWEIDLSKLVLLSSEKGSSS